MAEVDPLAWVIAAAHAADEKQGTDTIVLDVGKVLEITGWFVITSARNTRLMRTIAQEIEDRVLEVGGPRPTQIEGLDSADWVLLDYGDFVVHIFGDEARAYYELERLYRDMPVIEWAGTSPVEGPRPA